MYKVLVKNLEGFEKIFINDERGSLAKPFCLLKNLSVFNDEKKRNTLLYQNLYVIMDKAAKLKEQNKYHSFGMLITELDLQYFEFQEPNPLSIKLDPDVFEYQLSLLHQFMYPAYYN